MSSIPSPRWLKWAREIQALSQSGLHFAGEDIYNRQRYRRLSEIAAEIVASQCEADVEEALQTFQLQPGYATPKVDVRGALVRAGKILLVKERADGLWCMPGGWADVGESPAQMVIREVWEESGFQVHPYKIAGLFDANRRGIPEHFFHAYKVVFLCTIEGGEARPSDETEAVEFFSFDNLPQLSRDRTHESHIDEVKAHLGDPGRPSAFD